MKDIKNIVEKFVFGSFQEFGDKKAAQHSVHPTGGSLRVFRQFVWLEVDSDKMTLSRPRPSAGNASRWAEVERAHVEHGEKLKNMSHYEVLGRELNNMLI